VLGAGGGVLVGAGVVFVVDGVVAAVAFAAVAFAGGVFAGGVFAGAVFGGVAFAGMVFGGVVLSGAAAVLVTVVVTTGFAGLLEDAELFEDAGLLEDATGETGAAEREASTPVRTGTAD
jgi:hypothetical protein